MLTAATFVEQWPEFSDTTKYSTSSISFFLTLAYNMLNPSVWDANQIDFGAGLVVAHQLVLGARNQATAAAGGIPGTLTGPQSAKSVDKVSVTYNSDSVVDKAAGFWNLTTYGAQLWQIAGYMGAGPIQVNPAGPYLDTGLGLGVQWFVPWQ